MKYTCIDDEEMLAYIQYCNGWPPLCWIYSIPQ